MTAVFGIDSPDTYAALVQHTDARDQGIVLGMVQAAHEADTHKAPGAAVTSTPTPTPSATSSTFSPTGQAKPYRKKRGAAAYCETARTPRGPTSNAHKGTPERTTKHTGAAH